MEADNVAFDLVDGTEIDLPATFGQIHDIEGEYWPRCSILFGPVRRTRQPAGEIASSYDREYFGRNSELLLGSIVLPPRDLKFWRLEGRVERIWYNRKGTRYPGPYQHPFKKPPLIFGKDKPALLYTRGKWRRLELPAGCEVTHRGYVSP